MCLFEPLYLLNLTFFSAIFFLKREKGVRPLLFLCCACVYLLINYMGLFFMLVCACFFYLKKICLQLLLLFFVYIRTKYDNEQKTKQLHICLFSRNGYDWLIYILTGIF